MISDIKAQWSESSLLIKSINAISLIMLVVSIIIFFISSFFNNNKNLEIELNTIQSQLKIIEEFDKKFQGKWKHFLKDPPDIADLKKDLIELGLSNIQVSYDEKIFTFSGQINSIKELLNLISYTYNSRGLVINKLSIDVISEGLINIDLVLLY